MEINNYFHSLTNTFYLVINKYSKFLYYNIIFYNILLIKVVYIVLIFNFLKIIVLSNDKLFILYIFFYFIFIKLNISYYR